MDRNVRIAVAEAVGTAVLMIGGPGAAILAADAIGVLGVSLAFGFALLVMAYAIGPVSGCHINPAVTVGLAVAKKVGWNTVPYYVIGQLVGAAVGGGIIFAIVGGGDSSKDATGVFAANGWGDTLGNDYGLGAVIVVEVVFTALLIFAVLSTTRKNFPTAAGGLTAGMVLALIHLVTIPVDNTSVNPARSFGAAIFAGTDHLAQLWAFVVFPLVGGVLGALLWSVLGDQATAPGEVEERLSANAPKKRR